MATGLDNWQARNSVYTAGVLPVKCERCGRRLADGDHIVTYSTGLLKGDPHTPTYHRDCEAPFGTPRPPLCGDYQAPPSYAENFCTACTRSLHEHQQANQMRAEGRLTGDEIRAWIAQHGLSQARLAAALGLSRPAVEFWCQGRTDPPPYLWRLLRDLEQHDLKN